MPHSNTPSEIARKTLIELATRKLPPTPENYALLYRVIGGLPPPETEAATFLTNIISNCVRTTDDLVRYSGEEFLIIMPDTDIDNAKTLLVRLRRELTKQIFMHNNRQLPITFSAGVALRHDGEPPEEVIRRADHAMYLAKLAGKNRVQTAD